MTNTYGLSKREQEVVALLLEGKSNKLIAVALGVSDSTIEFHLTKIYIKLDVRSRAEAIIFLSQLRKTLVYSTSMERENDNNGVKENPGKSIVAETHLFVKNNSKNSSSNIKNSTTLGRMLSMFGKYTIPLTIGITLILASIIVTACYLFMPNPWSSYDRECEYPDAYTVGQTIRRSDASGAYVHGQFGTIDSASWPAQAGYVMYTAIRTPKLDDLFLIIRYSKNSSSSVPILIYIDNETLPRATFYPVDLADWNSFEWSEPIYLGSVNRGVHSIMFYTQGESYGVVDLDRFVLNATSP